MAADVVYNPNLLHLNRCEKNGTRGVVLAGSSRSGKTWSSVDFIIKLAANNPNSTINIIKETFKSFKTTLYDDFNRRLPDFGLNNPFADRQNVSTFKILGTRINLLGADKASTFHGNSCDFFYINEALEVPQSVFDNSEMRCRKFWWMDYNPKYLDHWIYNKVLPRADVSLLKTTFLDNPFVSKPEKNKILSYEPTPYNIAQGTADAYLWSVYGLGEMAAPEGLIYKNVEYIDEWPAHVDYVYGLDFGFTSDQSAFVKYGEDAGKAFVELLLYECTETPEAIDQILQSVGIDSSKPITADSSDKYTGENKGTVEMVSGLQSLGYNIRKVSKIKGKMFWINTLKNKKINVINGRLSQYCKNELGVYRFKKVNGIQVNAPEDGKDHFCDAMLYASMSFNTAYTPPLIW